MYTNGPSRAYILEASMIEPNVGKRVEHDDRAQKARECHGTTRTGLLRTTRDERRSFDRRCGGRRGVATIRAERREKDARPSRPLRTVSLSEAAPVRTGLLRGRLDS